MTDEPGQGTPRLCVGGPLDGTRFMARNGPAWPLLGPDGKLYMYRVAPDDSGRALFSHRESDETLAARGLEEDRINDQLRGFGMSELEITIFWNDSQPALDGRSPLQAWQSGDRAAVHLIVDNYPSA